MIPVVVRHRAEADVEKARAWYAREDERLGIRFTQEFTRTVDRIGALPDHFPGNLISVPLCSARCARSVSAEVTFKAQSSTSKRSALSVIRLWTE